VCVNALEKRGKLLLLGKRQFLRGMAFSLQFAIARMIPARIDGAGSPSLRPGPQGMSGAETEICKEPLTRWNNILQLEEIDPFKFACEKIPFANNRETPSDRQ
jgi:hypothetical protein